MLCIWISILLCLKHRYCFKFGGRKNILLVWWQFSVWELWGKKVFVNLRALRRKCVCIWELCGENVQRQAADLAELTPSPGEGGRGEGRRGEGEKGRRGRRMLIILMCPAADLPIAGLFSGASCNDITREPQMQSLMLQLICGLLHLMQAHVEV